MVEQSLIICPHCGTAKLEQMPTDACQFFYDCTGYGARLKPKPGDCCVFCSYGSVPCPPIQSQAGFGASCGAIKLIRLDSGPLTSRFQNQRQEKDIIRQ